MKFKYTPDGDKRSIKWNYEKSAKTIKEFITNDDVIYDIGANILDHSVYYAINYDVKKVYAFEPIKKYFDMGLKNIEDFNAKNIIAMNIGIGSKNEKLKIALDNEGSSILNVSQNKNIETVQIMTIDSLVEKKEILPPTIMKIDVEGFGVEALKGMEKTLLKYKPIILFEYHPHVSSIPMEEIESKLQMLRKLEYVPVKKMNGIEFYYKHKSLNPKILPINLWRNAIIERYMSKSWDLKLLYLSGKKDSKKQARKKYKELKNEMKKIKVKLPIADRLFWAYFIFWK